MSSIKLSRLSKPGKYAVEHSSRMIHFELCNLSLDVSVGRKEHTRLTNGGEGSSTIKIRRKEPLSVLQPKLVHRPVLNLTFTPLLKGIESYGQLLQMWSAKLCKLNQHPLGHVSVHKHTNLDRQINNEIYNVLLLGHMGVPFIPWDRTAGLWAMSIAFSFQPLHGSTAVIE